MSFSLCLPGFHDDFPPTQIVLNVISYLGNVLAMKRIWNRDKDFKWGPRCSSVVDEKISVWDKESNSNCFLLYRFHLASSCVWSKIRFVFTLSVPITVQHHVQCFIVVWQLITDSYLCFSCVMFTVDVSPFPLNICKHINVSSHQCGNTSRLFLRYSLKLAVCIYRSEDVDVDGSSLPEPLCRWTAGWNQIERSATSHLQRPRVARCPWQTRPQRAPGSGWECGYPRKRWQRWQEGWKGREGRHRYITKHKEIERVCR